MGAGAEGCCNQLAWQSIATEISIYYRPVQKCSARMNGCILARRRNNHGRYSVRTHCGIGSDLDQAVDGFMECSRDMSHVPESRCRDALMLTNASPVPHQCSKGHIFNAHIPFLVCEPYDGAVGRRCSRDRQIHEAEWPSSTLEDIIGMHIASRYNALAQVDPQLMIDGPGGPVNASRV